MMTKDIEEENHIMLHAIGGTNQLFEWKPYRNRYVVMEYDNEIKKAPVFYHLWRLVSKGFMDLSFVTRDHNHFTFTFHVTPDGMEFLRRKYQEGEI